LVKAFSATDKRSISGAVPKHETWRERPDRARLPRRVVLVAGIAIVLLLAPFLDHQSHEPLLLQYSLDYLLFLAALLLGGCGFACLLAWTVRRAPAHRQVPFALLILSFPVLAIAGAESYLGAEGADAFQQYRQWGHIRSPFTGFEVAPDHQWELDGVVYTTDENTFRTHVAPRTRPEQEFLIAAIGGSSTFGFGLNDDETWPHLLEQKLRKRFGNHVTVLNAACNGHNSLQLLIRLHLRVLPMRPNVVLYYGATNDVRLNDETDRLIDMPNELLGASSVRDVVRHKRKGEGFYFENSLLMETARRTLGEKYLEYEFDRKWPAPPVYNDDSFAESIGGYLHNIDTIRLLCEADGACFVPITYLADLQPMMDKWKAGVDFYSRSLRAHCLTHDWPFVDLYPAFEAASNKADLFFEDHYHPSRIGADFIAGQVADWLADRFGDELGGRKDWPVKATEEIATSLGDKTHAAEASSADHG
jgi:lysophospholipase L1-like esterase